MEFSFRLGGRTRAARVSARVSARWLAFARGEAPDAAAAATPDRAPDWPRFDASGRNTLIIDTVDRVESDPDAKLRAGWGDEILAFP
jgi:para-nitrobenzyl esterase